MPSVKRATVVAVFLWASICDISGSIIDFTSSHSSIKPLVTSNFTVRCSLNDTAAPGSPDAVVGRRSVGPVNKVVSEEDVLATHRLKKDTGRNVTSTPDDVMMVTSMIISRDGQDLATLVDHFTARPVGGATGYHVTGQLTPGAKVKGYLEVVWPRPSPQDAGNFRCDVDTISTGGHSYDFSQTLDVAEGEVSMADLVVELSAQQAAIDSLKLANDDLNRKNAAMSNEIIQLKSVQTPKVFFSAVYTKGPITVSGPVVYNEVWANEGGAYNSSTGSFTAPFSGFYNFELSAVTIAGQPIYLDLMKNDQLVNTVWTSGRDYNCASSSIIIKCTKGDIVYASGRSANFWGLGRKENTFTGQLVGLN